MRTKTVLASGILSEPEFKDFINDLTHIKVGEFMNECHKTMSGGLVSIELYSNELLPLEVVKKLLSDTLINHSGELHRLNWGRVIKIVD